MTVIVLTETRDILAALDNADLVPPDSSDSSNGSTRVLRDAMARFSRPAAHAARRDAVADAVASVDASLAESVASRLTAVRLNGLPLDATAAIGRVVPTETLATCLGVTGPFERVVADIEAMVRVIGRGEPATSDSDAAVDRLGSLFANHRSGSVPVLSILYQNFDATTALVGTSMLATATGRAAAPAVPRTRRVALDNTYLAGRTIPAGTEVTLEIGAAGLPFGAGPHQCPGQALAERIVAAVTSTIHDAGYRVDATNATFDADGRPISLPMRLF